MNCEMRPTSSHFPLNLATDLKSKLRWLQTLPYTNLRVGTKVPGFYSVFADFYQLNILHSGDNIVCVMMC